MAKQWRVGVIGSTSRGGYGHGLDTCWQEIPETTIVAVADDHADGLRQAGEKLKVEALFTDYRKMLDEAKPEIVSIAPRWIDQHRDMAVAAAERGIHIYMEKPFCRSLKEADDIVAACEKSGVALAVAHPTRYSPKLETVRRLIAEGKIGRVLEYRGRGKEDRRGGVEDLWVLGAHILDMLQALGGRPQWCYAEVRLKGQPVTKADLRDGPEGIGPLAGDEIVAMFGMPDTSVAHFASRQNAGGSPSRYALQIYGSAGIFEIIEGTLPPVKFFGHPSWSPPRSGVTWQDVSSAGIGLPEPLKGPEYTSRHILAMRDLLESIEQKRTPKCSMYAARDVLEMISAVFESHRQKKPVPLPLTSRDGRWE